MESLHYQSRPKLRRPVLIAAFQGWNDAADAASMALGFIEKQWAANSFASIDPEEFYDFTVRRPTVAIDPEGIRRIDWPQTRFASASMPGTDRDVILLSGWEPALRWRTFAQSVMQVISDTDVEMVVTLGALLSNVPHTRPVHVTGTAHDAELAANLGFVLSRYEGPTGILGIIGDAARRADVPFVNLWAQVPFYLQANPSPKAALALLRHLQRLLGVEVETDELERDAVRYEVEVADAVERDPDVVAQVQELEAEMEEPLDMASGDELAAELEQFLRDQGPDS